MPPNPHLVSRLKAIQDALMAQHRGGQGLSSAVSGNERETFLREFLQKLFPAHRRFSTGVITDSAHRMSGQVDIAVEYGFIPSFPMPSTDDRLLLAESVAMVIEVKSDIVAQWDQVRRTLSKVKPLQRTLNPFMVLGSNPGLTIPCVAGGYKGNSTVEQLQNRLAATPPDERPDYALVINSGCFTGPDISADGPFGLYALCLAINAELTRLAVAAPDLVSY